MYATAAALSVAPRPATATYVISNYGEDTAQITVTLTPEQASLIRWIAHKLGEGGYSYAPSLVIERQSPPTWHGRPVLLGYDEDRPGSVTAAAKLARRGLKVQRETDALGNPLPRGGWQLIDMGEAPAPLLIGDHGMVSPTKWEAVAEGLGRIERGEY